jgi:4-amino-4-deoxy-L-arabinose transferase-like glycosyltransferase
MAAGVICVLALAFQGSRGLWEPDEGFYANVAHGMLESGDWLVPRLSGEPFLDKPPLHYWEMAAGMWLLGQNEWGARLPHALHLLATSLLVGLFAARLWGKRTGLAAAVLYAMTLAPFIAANVLTPDTPLTTCTVALYYAYWRARSAPRGWPGLAWWLAMGAAAGLGVLAKGPAMLLFAAPAIAHLALTRPPAPFAWRTGALLGAAVALLVAVPWYVYVATSLPGAVAYMLDNQVVGRLFTATYGRNPGWSGGLRVYLPTLAVGALPWSAFWLMRLARWALGRREPVKTSEPEGARSLLLLWGFLPAAVLLLARSRLPLYVLPLFAPITLVTARALVRDGGFLAGSWARPRILLPLAGWCVALVAIKAGAAHWVSSNDTRETDRVLRRELDPARVEIVAVDLKRNALAFYGWKHFETISTARIPYPFYAPLESFDEELREMRKNPLPHAFITAPDRAAHIARLLEQGGMSCRPPVSVATEVVIVCEPASANDSGVEKDGPSAAPGR